MRLHSSRVREMRERARLQLYERNAPSRLSSTTSGTYLPSIMQDMVSRSLIGAVVAHIVDLEMRTRMPVNWQ